jgi:hypothetical protein
VHNFPVSEEDGKIIFFQSILALYNSLRPLTGWPVAPNYGSLPMPIVNLLAPVVQATISTYLNNYFEKQQTSIDSFCGELKAQLTLERQSQALSLEATAEVIPGNITAIPVWYMNSN